jgi:hypothetical protein
MNTPDWRYVLYFSLVRFEEETLLDRSSHYFLLGGNMGFLRRAEKFVYWMQNLDSDKEIRILERKRLII